MLLFGARDCVFQWPFKWPFKTLKGHLKGHPKNTTFGRFAAHFGAAWHPLGPLLGASFLLFRTLGALLAVLGGLIAASRSLHRLGCVAVEVFWLFGHCLVAFGVEFDHHRLHPSSCIAVWSHRV